MAPHAQCTLDSSHLLADDSDGVLRNLLISNSEWVEGVLRFQPHFFEDSAKGQSPHVRGLHLLVLFYLNTSLQTLWIGCSDSRVPESVITLARPGDIFVHRNIAKYGIMLLLRQPTDITAHLARSTWTTGTVSLSLSMLLITSALNMV